MKKFIIEQIVEGKMLYSVYAETLEDAKRRYDNGDCELEGDEAGEIFYERCYEIGPKAEWLDVTEPWEALSESEEDE